MPSLRTSTYQQARRFGGLDAHRRDGRDADAPRLDDGVGVLQQQHPDGAGMVCLQRHDARAAAQVALVGDLRQGCLCDAEQAGSGDAHAPQSPGIGGSRLLALLDV